QVASVGRLADGKVADVGLTDPVAGGTSSVLNANVANYDVVGSSTALIGASALSPTQATGQVASVGVLSGAQVLNVDAPALGAADGAVGGLTNAVNGVVDGVTGLVSGTSSGGLSDLSGGLTGSLSADASASANAQGDGKLLGLLGD